MEKELMVGDVLSREFHDANLNKAGYQHLGVVVAIIEGKAEICHQQCQGGRYRVIISSYKSFLKGKNVLSRERLPVKDIDNLYNKARRLTLSCTWTPEYYPFFGKEHIAYYLIGASDIVLEDRKKMIKNLRRRTFI